MALAVVLGCTPKVKIESPEEPIRIEMTVTVRHEVDQDLERLFREQDALVGRLAPAPAADGQVTLEFRILSEAAQALENAKFDGSLGEQRDGYLGLVSADAPAAVQRLRAAVNASRRQSYADIAAAHAVSADAVANASGELLIGRASPGQFVRDAGGAWSRR